MESKRKRGNKNLHLFEIAVAILILIFFLYFVSSPLGHVISEKEDKSMSEETVVDNTEEDTTHVIIEKEESNEPDEEPEEENDEGSSGVGYISEKAEPEEEEEVEETQTEEENIIEEVAEEDTEEEIIKDNEFGIMAAPTSLEVMINSSLETNYSTENITCWASASDADSTYLNYSGFWYKDGEVQLSNWSGQFPIGIVNYGRGVTVDSNDNIISVGYTTGWTNLTIVKHYSNGTIMWNNTFGDPVNNEYGYGVGVDNNGDILAVGSISGFIDGPLMVKYNSSGSLLWNKTYDWGSGYWAEDAAFFSNGDFVIGGGSNNISKFNSSGDLLYNWNRSNFQIQDIAIDSNEDIIVTGDNGGSCYRTEKFNSSGTLIWNVTFGCGLTWTRWSYGVEVDSNDNVIITGVTFNYDAVTVKYNSSGDYLWNDSFVNGVSGDYGRDVAVDSRDNIYILTHPTSGNSIFIMKYNTSGSRIWNKTIDKISSTSGYAIEIDSEDNIVFAGDDNSAAFVERLYGFNLHDQTQGVFSNISSLDESLLLSEEVWSCEVKAFDGGNYTNYTQANVTILNVPLYCGINITEQLTANETLSCTGTALNIVSNGVVLDCGGNNIVGNNTPGTYGVRIKNGINNTIIENCYVYNFSEGIYLSNSSNSTIDNNILQNNLNNGIKIESCFNNTISSNSFYDNNYGLDSSYSFSNIHSNNLFSNNSGAGIYLFNSFEEIITINDIENNPLYGILISNGTMIDVEDNDVSLNYQGILMNYSSNNTLFLNDIENNTGSGIYFYNSSENDFFTNSMEANNKSIFVENSNNNTFYSNTIINSSYGLFLSNSNYNLIYDNYFNNTINAYDQGTNYWNTTLELEENILSGDYLGGNYWSDYTGNDSDRDGIGDTELPFNLSGNISGEGDWLPLVEPFRVVKMITLLVNSSDPSNTPDNDITCWANATHESNNNITYHGVWHKNTEQIFENSLEIDLSNLSTSGSIFQPSTMAIDSQNNIIIETSTTGAAANLTAVKINSSGSLIWNNGYIYANYGKGVDIDSQDNIIVTGYNSSSNDLRMVTVKYNSSGSLIWNASFNSTQGYDVAVDSNDSVISVGSLYLGGFTYKMIVVKYNSSGSYLWNATNSPKSALRVAIDNQDNAVILCTQYMTTVVSKYSSNGTFLWNKSYDISSYIPSASYAIPRAIAVDSYNNIYITGILDDRVFTAKIDKYGNLIWVEDFYLDYNSGGISIFVDEQDNILVSGYLNSSVGLIVKYDPDGNALWHNLFYEDYLLWGWDDIAMDNRFDIVVAGRVKAMKYSGFNLDNQLPGQLLNLSTIPSSSIGNGDTWKCEVIAFDAENYSRYKESNELTLYTPGTSGGGAGACISSWSCGDPGSCTDGQAEVLCTDSNGCFTSTNRPSGCVSSGHAQCIKTISCGEEEEEKEENVTETFPEEELTVEEAAEQISQELGCTPVFECEDWEECRVDYGLDELIEEEYIELGGTQIRNCYDTTDCVTYPIEKEQECTITVPISLIEDSWGNETYVFVQDETTGQNVARIKLGSLYLTFMPTSYLGYYDYCFDDVKNYDETDVDCGGENCPKCSEGHEDNFLLIKSFVLAFGFVATFFVIYSLMRSFTINSIKKVVKAAE